MEIMRTPDQRFSDLPGFQLEPHYHHLEGLRIHHVDEGAGEPVLCLHGEPTWSYLYRRMIPVLAGPHRVVAPDFPGFGRSDKPARQRDYSFALHRDVLLGLLERLDLRRITLVVQDWGGLVGLRAVSLMPERFARLVILNTALPTGRRRPPLLFRAWLAFARWVPSLPVGLIVRVGCARPLTREVVAAYRAPFPDRRFKAGARAWPAMVPTRPTDEVAAEMVATRGFLSGWDRPALVMFSDRDPFLGGLAGFFRRLIPSASRQPEVVIRGAGHFLQEDAGAEIARHVLDFMART